MLDITKDIQSLTTFRRRSRDFMKQLKKTKRPVVLTVKGKPEAVVLDAGAYQRLLDIAAAADAREGIRQGLEESRRGLVQDAEEFFAELKPRVAYRVELAARARRDLSAIYDRIGASSSDAAFNWYQGLNEAIRTLNSNPNRCPRTTEDPSLRHLLYGHKPNVYRVVYRVIESQKRIHVLHIRHGARQEFRPSHR